MSTAIEPHPITQTAQSLWQRLGPALSAAVCVSWALILQELMSDLIPFFGSLMTLPVWMFLYYLQGLMTGFFARRDPRTQSLSTARLIGLGVISALWTGVVFSTILSLLGLVMSSVLTAGAAIMTVPLTIAGSLLDVLLNLVFTCLGVWVYAARDGKRLTGPSCVVGLSGLIGYCLIVAIGLTLLATGGYHSLEPILKNWSLPIPPLR